MKKFIATIVLFLILQPTFSKEAKYDCTFMGQAENEINHNPTLQAKNNYEKNNIHFLAAGVGIASTINGIERKEFSCVYKNYNIDTIWGGGDVMACAEQYELGKKIKSYVSKYNAAMKKLLTKSGAYKCSM